MAQIPKPGRHVQRLDAIELWLGRRWRQGQPVESSGWQCRGPGHQPVAEADAAGAALELPHLEATSILAADVQATTITAWGQKDVVGVGVDQRGEVWIERDRADAGGGGAKHADVVVGA